MSKPRKKRSRFWYTLGIGGGVLLCLIGAATGVGSYTFYYGEGASYLSNNAEACANCHVMQSHYDAWIKSSHRVVATCNDCHTPHDSFIGKYYSKARNGFFHSLAFTTGDFPDEILINEFNRNVTEQACRSCHEAVVHQIDLAARNEGGSQMSCIRCHRDVGHPR